MVVVTLVVETPLTAPDLIGRPPLVKLALETGSRVGAGVVLGLAEGEEEGVVEATGLAEGVGLSRSMRLVVALKV